MLANRNTRLLILTLILLLGAAARIIGMDRQSLWADEGYTYFVTTQPDMLPTLAADVHPPLYFVLLRGWIPLAGVSEMALRFFSLLPSMLSIAGVYQLSKELVRAREGTMQRVVPVLAALMMALADAENHLAQEARMYTLHTFFAVVSMWAFLRWVRTPGRGWLALWVLSTTALAHTHYLGVWTPLVQGLYALVFLRGRTRRWAIGALALSGLLFLPWMLGVGLGQLDNGEGFNRAVPSNWDTLMDFRIKWLSQQWSLLLGLALLGLVTLVYNHRVRVRWRPFGPALLLLMWIVVPLALTFFFNTWIPMLTARRVSQITPAVALLVAFGLGNIRPPVRAFLVAVIVVYGVTTVDYYRPKPPWREVGANLARYAVPGDLVLTDIGGGDDQIGYYADRLLPAGVEKRSLRRWYRGDPGGFLAGLFGLLIEHPHVWLMHWAPDQQIFGWLGDNGYVNTAIMTVDHVGNALNVYRFDQLPVDDAAVYQNGMRLRDARVHPDLLRVDLWWSVDEPLAADYTTSAFLLDEAGRLVAQYDSYPFVGERPTSAWQTGDVIYDPKPLELQGMDTLPAGRYTVGVQVYTWTPEGTQRSLTRDTEQQWAVVGSFEK